MQAQSVEQHVAPGGRFAGNGARSQVVVLELVPQPQPAFASVEEHSGCPRSLNRATRHFA